MWESERRVRTFNVWLLGIAFCLIFSGFNTTTTNLIMESAARPGSAGYVEGFTGNGFISAAIVYGVFTLANWVAPSAVALMGPRMTMIVGASVYVVYLVQLQLLNDILLYSVSALLGLGAALLWTAQGNFLCLNSDERDMSKNSGIFWALQISSSFFGNIFVFFQFKDKEDIDTRTRTTVGAALLGVTTCGTCALLLLRPPTRRTGEADAQLEAADPQIEAADLQREAADPRLEAADPQLKAADPQLEAADPQLWAAPPNLEGADPQRNVANQQLDATVPLLKSTIPQLEAAIPQLESPEQQLRAIAPELEAADPQLEAVGPQQKAANQQLEATDQQLEAAEQQLEATVQQLTCNGKQLEVTNQQLGASYQQLEAANQQLWVIDQQMENPDNKLGNQHRGDSDQQLETGGGAAAADSQLEAAGGRVRQPIKLVEAEGPLAALQRSGRLLMTKHMLLLSLTFLYSGLLLNIWSGLYATCVGFTISFGSERKSLAIICGMAGAVAEVLVGAAFGIFGRLTARYAGRDTVVMVGFVASQVVFFLMFLLVPREAPLGETQLGQTGFIDPNKYLAVFTGFLLGAADGCYNTQIYSLLGTAYADESASAFAIFKFMQSASSAMAFAYSSRIWLWWQLLIAEVFSVVGTIAFCIVEWDLPERSASTTRPQENSINP